MTGRTLHPDVEAELANRFSGQEWTEASALLQSTTIVGVKDYASLGAARIHLAAIKSAGGSLERLRVAMKLASEDWRDLLVSAGLEHANWQQVLADNGFRAPQ